MIKIAFQLFCIKDINFESLENNINNDWSKNRFTKMTKDKIIDFINEKY